MSADAASLSTLREPTVTCGFDVLPPSRSDRCWQNPRVPRGLRCGSRRCDANKPVRIPACQTRKQPDFWHSMIGEQCVRGVDDCAASVRWRPEGGEREGPRFAPSTVTTAVFGQRACFLPEGDRASERQHGSDRCYPKSPSK